MYIYIYTQNIMSMVRRGPDGEIHGWSHTHVHVKHTHLLIA